MGERGNYNVLAFHESSIHWMSTISRPLFSAENTRADKMSAPVMAGANAQNHLELQFQGIQPPLLASAGTRMCMVPIAVTRLQRILDPAESTS